MNAALDTLRGIAGYALEQAVILRVLRRYGPLTDKQFDRIFSGYKTRLDENHHAVTGPRKPKIRFIPMNSHAFILGGCAASEHQKWLHLLLLMVDAGLVRCELRGDEVQYSEAK